MAKKAFVTGATGFIGANLVRRLLDGGFEVHVGTRKSSNKWRLEEVYSQIHDHDFDLLDNRSIKRLMEDIRPDFIFNMAIYGGYPAQSDIDKIMNTNFIGAFNLLNACDKIDYSCFVQVGSSSEYGPKTNRMKEDMLLEPTNAYGVSKAAASLYAQYVAKEKNKPVTIVRPFSPFGYFEEPTRLVPSLIKNCVENKEPELASAAAVRDFVFVDDLIDALMLIINNPQKVKGEILNIGRGEQVSVGDMAKKVISMTNTTLSPKFGSVVARQYDANVWFADISKIGKLLGWKPKTTVDEGLKRTIGWFRKNKRYYA